MRSQLKKLSNYLASFELAFAGFLVALMTILIVINVVTRALNHALFWVDEAAIFVMVWAVFLGSIVLMKRRQMVAVTLIKDWLPPSLKQLYGVIYDLSILVFAILLLVFSWIWYQPYDLWLHNFDVMEFSASSMNFIYQEISNTLRWPKYVVWWIIPYMGLSCLFHSAVNLLNDPTGKYVFEEETK